MSVHGSEYDADASALVARLAAEPAVTAGAAARGGSHSLWLSHDSGVSAMSQRRRSRSPRDREPDDAIKRAKAALARRCCTAGTRVQDVSLGEMQAELDDAVMWVAQAVRDGEDEKKAKAYKRKCDNRLSAKRSRDREAETRRAESETRHDEQARLASLEAQVATLRTALAVAERRAVRAEEEAAALSVQLTAIQEGLDSEAAASPHLSAMQGGGSRFTV
jgi:hypothetical protein